MFILFNKSAALLASISILSFIFSSSPVASARGDDERSRGMGERKHGPPPQVAPVMPAPVVQPQVVPHVAQVLPPPPPPPRQAREAPVAPAQVIDKPRIIDVPKSDRPVNPELKGGGVMVEQPLADGMRGLDQRKGHDGRVRMEGDRANNRGDQGKVIAVPLPVEKDLVAPGGRDRGADKHRGEIVKVPTESLNPPLNTVKPPAGGVTINPAVPIAPEKQDMRRGDRSGKMNRHGQDSVKHKGDRHGRYNGRGHGYYYGGSGGVYNDYIFEFFYPNGVYPYDNYIGLEYINPYDYGVLYGYSDELYFHDPQSFNARFTEALRTGNLVVSGKELLMSDRFAKIRTINNLSLAVVTATERSLERLSYLTNLRKLVLFDSVLRDSSLRYLRQIAGLKKLDLTQVDGLTGDGVNALKRSRPNLEIKW